MAEYMSREDYCEITCGKENREGYKTCHNCSMLNVPSTDVQPVIHAKWILFDRDSVGRAFYCSNCRKVTTTDDYEDTPLDRDEYFCMRCGADMRSPDATKG